MKRKGYRFPKLSAGRDLTGEQSRNMRMETFWRTVPGTVRQIVGYKKLPKEKIFEIKKELKENKVNYELKDYKDLFYERKSLSAVVRASEENVLPKVTKQMKTEEEKAKTNTSTTLKQEDNVSTLNSFTPPPGYGYVLRYTTFIPMKYAPNPWCEIVCTYKYFGGDDRSFDFWSNKFRTIYMHLKTMTSV